MDEIISVVPVIDSLEHQADPATLDIIRKRVGITRAVETVSLEGPAFSSSI